jgi:hypothetical protein
MTGHRISPPTPGRSSLRARLRLLLLAAPLLAAPLASGCVYERVEMFMAGDNYHGTILSDYDNVEVTRSAIILKPGARFAVRIEQVTQWLGQYEVKIDSGSGMIAYLRTVPHDFDGSQGIAFRYAVDGCSVRTSGGRTIPLAYNAETDPQTLSFYNEADRMTISAGCKEIYREDSDLPGTEFIIFETLPNSTVELRSVAYFDTNGE